MRKGKILTAGILAAALSVSVCAWAEDAPKKSPGDVIGDLIGSFLEDHDVAEEIFGEDGLLSEVLPEGIDIGEIADSLEEKVDVIKVEGEQIIENVLDKVKNEDGSFDFSGLDLGGLGDLAGGLIGAITGSDESDGFDLDAYLAEYDAVNELIDEYCLAKNSEIAETGDEQILSTYHIYIDEDLGDVLKAFIEVDIANYTADDTDLRFLSGSSTPILFTLNRDEESGSYAITEAREPVDGEGFTDSLQEMCDEVGISLEECFEEIEAGKIFQLYDMVNFLNERPEYERIEFEGELRTAEELDEIYSERLMELFDESETDSETAAESAETVVVESVETVEVESVESVA